MLCDSSYILGDARLFAAVAAITILAIFMVGVVMQYQDMTNTYLIFKYLGQIKYRKIRYPLNRENNKIFITKFNLFTKYSLRIVFWVTAITGLTTYNSVLIIGFTHFNFQMKIIPLIFWWITFMVALEQGFSILWFGVTLWYACALYLKMKFNEVNDSILLMANKKYNQMWSSFAMIESIKEHKFLEDMTKDWNHFFGSMTFIVYFIATPGLQMLAYGTHRSQITLFGRIFCSIVGVNCLSGVVMMNLMSTWINTAAHKPYNNLYSYLVRRKRVFPIGHRIKIKSFIEHISGTDIGFYCLDLFPMTNFEFFQYLYIFGANYFLIMDFF